MKYFLLLLFSFPVIFASQKPPQVGMLQSDTPLKRQIIFTEDGERHDRRYFVVSPQAIALLQQTEKGREALAEMSPRGRLTQDIAQALHEITHQTPSLSAGTIVPQENNCIRIDEETMDTCLEKETMNGIEEIDHLLTRLEVLPQSDPETHKQIKQEIRAAIFKADATREKMRLFVQETNAKIQRIDTQLLLAPRTMILEEEKPKILESICKGATKKQYIKNLEDSADAQVTFGKDLLLAGFIGFAGYSIAAGNTDLNYCDLVNACSPDNCPKTCGFAASAISAFTGWLLCFPLAGPALHEISVEKEKKS